MKLIDADLFLEEIQKGATVEDLKKLVTECKGVPVTVDAEPVKTLKQIPEACKNCSNQPSNGGSGICFCTLGSMTTTY